MTSPDPSSDARSAGGRDRGAALTVLALPTTVVALDLGALLLALLQLSADLGADGTQQLWIVDSYGWGWLGWAASARRCTARKLLVPAGVPACVAAASTDHIAGAAAAAAHLPAATAASLIQARSKLSAPRSASSPVPVTHRRQFGVLDILHREPHRSAAELARAGLVSRQTMNGLLRQLEALGAVERTDHTWGRAIGLRLTTHGQQLHAAARQIADDVERATLGWMSDEEHQLFTGLLARMHRHIAPSGEQYRSVDSGDNIPDGPAWRG
jgi:DNA-binding MarR family transcriptional regulator